MASIVERGGKFLVRVTKKGHPQVNKTFTARRDAERFAKSVEVDIERGVFKQDRGDRVVFRDLLIRYLAEITPGKRGCYAEGNRLRAMLAPVSVARRMLDKPVEDLKPHHVVSWRDARLKQVAPGSVAREWGTLAHVLQVARLDWGFEWIRTPFAGVRKPEVRDGRDRRISADELEAVCKSALHPDLEVFVRLAIETAARRSELLALEWRDVDLKRSVMTLRQTKNGEVRTVPLSPVAVGLLRSTPRNLDGRVFTVKPLTITQAFTRAVLRARRDYVTKGGDDPQYLTGLRLHDCRHEACSRLAELGLSTMELAAISGHKTVQLLARYTHLRPEDLAVKLARLSV